MSSPSSAPVQDPPLPNRVNQVRPMTPEESRAATQQMLALAGILLGIAALAWYLGHPVFAALCGLLGLVSGVSAFTKKSLVASCPFCHELITGFTEKMLAQRRFVRCNECFEYSQMAGGKLQAADPSTVSPEPRFVSPVFEAGVWPNGCVLCGEPPVRFDELRGRNLVIPSVAAAQRMLATASIKNVPYCGQHRDAVRVTMSVSRKIDLKWRSLRMMRRYLAANRGRTSLGSKLLLNIQEP